MQRDTESQGEIQRAREIKRDTGQHTHRDKERYRKGDVQTEGTTDSTEIQEIQKRYRRDTDVIQKRYRGCAAINAPLMQAPW